MTHEPNGSFVYVLTNPAMPGLVKIGRTSASDPADRAASLYGTGVPLPFEVEFAATVDNPAEVETALHSAFRDSRVNPKREFFRIEPEQAIDILRLLNVEDSTEDLRSETSSVVGPDEAAASERFKKRRPQLNFEEMGIEVGERLVFARDESVDALVAEPKKVTFHGRLVALSRATMEALGTDYYVAPTGYWRWNGRLLTEIYDETYPSSEHG